jgi:uncharacterized protein YycO
MKRIPKYLLILLSLQISSCTEHVLQLKDGDIVFQTSRSSQSKAIQLATGSKYSHMGMVLTHEGEQMVYEAVEPVKFTPLASWIKRGNGSHFVAKRLKNADTILTQENMSKLYSTVNTFLGKPYDLVFNWSDDKLYCSELVWKLFDRAANVQIGRLQKLRDFDLSSPEVQSKLKERYGQRIPLDETVISPGQMFQSNLLVVVYEQ